MDTTLPQSAEDKDQGDRRRARILDHALTSFLANGYEGANIEDIAIAAGVSKVTIYRYFGDKAGLVGAVIRLAAQEMIAACRQPLDEAGSVEDVLTDFAIRYITWMNHNVGTHPFYEISRLVMEVSYHHPEITRAWSATLARDMAHPLLAYIEKQVSRNLLGPENAAFLTSHFFQSLVYASATILAPTEGSLYIPPSQHEIAAVARRKVRLFLRGCQTA